MNKLLRKLRCRKGQGAVEYALLVLAIVLIVTAVLLATNNPLRTAITGAFQRATNAINTAQP